MKRSNIYLTEKQRDFLQRLADYYGITRSEYIRRVLDEHIERKEKEAFTLTGAKK